VTTFSVTVSAYELNHFIIEFLMLNVNMIMDI
jgi:hypothetical protein